jgi:hypothetical protein
MERFWAWTGWALLPTCVAACTAEIPGGPADPMSTGGSGTGGSSTGTGGLDGSGGGSVPRDPVELEAACAAHAGELTMGLSKLRRLTRRQIDSTLADLLGVQSNPASGLAPDERLGPFENNAITPITDLLVEQLQEMAKRVADEVTPRRTEIMGCDATVEAACAEAFVGAFAKRAFRRPLTAEEAGALLGIYQLGFDSEGADHGFHLVIEALVQSSSFLYHVDVPTSNVAIATVGSVSPYTLASRLSYFLWNSMPDQELFDLADSGALLSPSSLETQVTRMLADDRAIQTLGAFHEQWLGVTGLEEKTKDQEQFPLWSSGLASSMLEETRRFSSYVVREGDGLLSTLLTADFTLPDENLLQLYGIAAPPGFVTGDVVQVPNRAGILTQPAFLTKNSHLDQTSVVHRGLVVRRNVLCQVVDPPPAAVSTALPEVTEATTTRERLKQHVASAACAGCHSMIDPLGYAFEHYDPIGAYRTQDGLGPVDASGEFYFTGEDLQGTYANAAEMMTMMASAEEVENCVSDQWFRFALGRMESLDDACTLLDLHDAFAASSGNIRTLLFQIASSQAFLNVRSTAQVSP